MKFFAEMTKKYKSTNFIISLHYEYRKFDSKRFQNLANKCIICREKFTFFQKFIFFSYDKVLKILAILLKL